MRNRIIGWRTFGNMKKQHLTFYTYNGDAAFHCLYERPSSMSVDGKATNIIEKSDLIINTDLPKCKKCLKEEKRIENINKQKET